MLDALNLAAFTVTLASVVVSALMFVNWSEYDYQDGNIYKKCFIFCIVLAVIGRAGMIFLPSKTTAYKMLVASYITPDNINSNGQFTQDTFKDFLEGIVETARRIKNL